MSEDSNNKNKNIRRFVSRKTKNEIFAPKNKLATIKNYLGFEYVKLEKDVNGISFKDKSLKDFRDDLKYTISIMRKIDEKIYLYEYFVSGFDLKKFFKACIDGKIEGEIIQIEKYIQDFPA